MQEAQKKHLVESIHTVVGIVKSSCDHHLFVRGTKLDLFVRPLFQVQMVVSVDDRQYERGTST